MPFTLPEVGCTFHHTTLPPPPIPQRWHPSCDRSMESVCTQLQQTCILNTQLLTTCCWCSAGQTPEPTCSNLTYMSLRTNHTHTHTPTQYFCEDKNADKMTKEREEVTIILEWWKCAECTNFKQFYLILTISMVIQYIQISRALGAF